MVYHDAGKRYEEIHRGGLPEKIPAVIQPGNSKDPIYRIKEATDPEGRVWHYLIPFYSVPVKQEGETTLRQLSNEVVYHHTRATSRFFQDIQSFCVGGKLAYKKYHELSLKEIDAALVVAERLKHSEAGEKKVVAATEVLYLQVMKLSHLTIDVINDVYSEIKYTPRRFDEWIYDLKRLRSRATIDVMRELYDCAIEAMESAKIVVANLRHNFHVEDLRETNPDIYDPKNPEARRLFRWIQINIEWHPNYPLINELYQELLNRKNSEDIIRIPPDSWMRKPDLNTMLQEAISEIYKALIPNLEFGFYNDRAGKVAEGQCGIDYICQTLATAILDFIKLPHKPQTIAVIGELKEDLPQLAQKSKLAICVRRKDPNPGLYPTVQMDYRQAIWKAKATTENITERELDPKKIITPLLELGVNTIENIVSARMTHKQAMQDYKNLYHETMRNINGPSR